MLLNTDELNTLYKLKFIVRYNTKARLKNETVAEHSFYTALLAMKIIDKCNLSSQHYTKLLVIEKALLHDMPEIETNDITHDAKEKMKLRTFLKQYEDNYYEREFPNYVELMTKENELVDIIVDLADAYSVLQYSNYEIMLGNTSNEMKIIFEDANQRINKLEKKLGEKYGYEL